MRPEPIAGGEAHAAIAIAGTPAPPQLLIDVMKAMKELCEARYEAFGAADKASKIRTLARDTMAQRYESGELDPKVH